MMDKAPKAKKRYSSILKEYTEEETEFLRAMEHYKTVNHRPHPTWCEVLEVLKSLGYRKDPE